MSARHKGRKLTPEHRAAIGVAGKGRKHSAETKAKIGASQKGRKLPAHQLAILRQPKTLAHRFSLSKARSLGALPPGWAEFFAQTRAEDRTRIDTAYRYWKRYCLTVEDVARMYERQAGLCLCGKPLPTRWHVDHDHASGRFRGLLHPACNHRLLPWVERIGPERIAAYLAEPSPIDTYVEKAAA